MASRSYYSMTRAKFIPSFRRSRENPFRNYSGNGWNAAASRQPMYFLPPALAIFRRSAMCIRSFHAPCSFAICPGAHWIFEGTEGCSNLTEFLPMQKFSSMSVGCRRGGDLKYYSRHYRFFLQRSCMSCSLAMAYFVLNWNAIAPNLG